MQETERENCCFLTNKIWTPDLLPCASPTPGLESTSQIAHYICQASNSSEWKRNKAFRGKWKEDGICFHVNLPHCVRAKEGCHVVLIKQIIVREHLPEFGVNNPMDTCR